MVRTDLPYTYIAKGKYWRFRREGVDAALPGKPGDEAFHTAYAEKLARFDKPKEPVDPQSFSWLMGRYRRSPEFASLADTTQLDYGKTMDLLEIELGKQPYRFITKAMVKAVRDDHADKARKAHKIKQMVSRLYSWAEENDLVREGFNPAAAVKRIKRKGGAREIAVWSDHEVAVFTKHCAARMLTPVLLALYTGQRLSDVVKMTWLDYQADMIRVRQSKTHAPLMIACHKALRRHLDALKKRPRVVVPMPDQDFICMREDGVAWSANAFGSAMSREVRRIAGMPQNRSMHGLRYAAGSRMEEAGCTVAEIESVLGHQTFKMALKYASQRLRAKAAVAKMEAAGE